MTSDKGVAARVSRITPAPECRLARIFGRWWPLAGGTAKTTSIPLNLTDWTEGPVLITLARLVNCFKLFEGWPVAKSKQP